MTYRWLVKRTSHRVTQGHGFGLSNSLVIYRFWPHIFERNRTWWNVSTKAQFTRLSGSVCKVCDYLPKNS